MLNGFPFSFKSTFTTFTVQSADRTYDRGIVALPDDAILAGIGHD